MTGFHVYATDWRPGCVDFFVDGDHVRTVAQAPDYPMQMMIGVFDFPMRPAAAVHAGHVPLFAIDYVREASTRNRPGLDGGSACRSLDAGSAGPLA